MPEKPIEVDEKIVNTAFRKMILNTSLIFQDIWMSTHSGWDPQINQTTIHSNLAGFEYSNKYEVRFRGFYKEGYEKSWQLTVVLKGATEETPIFTIVIPHKAFIRLQFERSGDTVFCRFCTANPNPPLDKNCRTREERLGFSMSKLSAADIEKFENAVEELIKAQPYVSYPGGPVYLSTPYF
jgi:hypothetical protein